MTPSKTSSLLSRIPGGWIALVAIGIAFLLGFLLRGGGDAPTPGDPGIAPTSASATEYTCSMHPAIRLPNADDLCPICGMELIPVSGGADDDAPPRQFSMSEAARSLADIQTAPAQRRLVVKEVRMVGMVDYDETRLRTITAWVPGRLDRLYVDYTGVAVQKGAPMAYMYSPELLVAQQALLKADEAYSRMKEAGVDARNLEMQRGTVAAAADRLSLWGLLDEQIGEIRTRGTASDHMTILSPISGIVIHKNAAEGDYVKVGSKVYQIADLSRIWIYLDAYESDLTWIRYAQEVQFEAEAYPGEVFRGRVSFIDPFLDKRTRTVKVRVSVDNLDGRLKPGMFVRARVHSTLAAAGKIVEPFLAGKWISPVHPEVVVDEPGDCPICGTPLVSAESLGYVGTDAARPLVIPVTAPLRTGKRALVYVALPDAKRPTFEGREIALGPRTKDHYIVKDGLEENELVVTRGNFKIDSALQILAKPSMMSPPVAGAEAERMDVPAEFVAGLSPLLQSYLNLQRALASDDLEAVRDAARTLKSAGDSVQMGLLAGDAHERWMELRSVLVADGAECARTTDLAAARVTFDRISMAVLTTVRTFGQATGADLHEAHCPMAFDNRGASWLADTPEIRNPYYGARMLKCGSVQKAHTSLGTGPSIPNAFRTGLSPFFAALVRAQEALAGDDLAASREAAALVSRALDGLSASPGEPWLVDIWGQLRSRGTDGAERMQQATDLEGARAAFDGLSRVGIATLKRFGHTGPERLKEAFCPMAFDGRGASWLQHGDEIRNPYFGARMLKCGETLSLVEPSLVIAVPEGFLVQLSDVVTAYLEIGDALFGDELQTAIRKAGALEDALASVDARALDAETKVSWGIKSKALRDGLRTLAKAATIEEARRPYAVVSDTLASALAELGHAGPDELVEVHCGMAFGNRGANWIQRGETIRNPYFGAAMPRCGEIERKLPTQPEGE